MRIVRETQCFGELYPNETFRRVLSDSDNISHQAELAVSNLCMVVKDGEFLKAYDLVDHVIYAVKKAAPIIRVKTKLVILRDQG